MESLQYSGLGLTEDSTAEEIYAALAHEYPDVTYIYKAGTMYIELVSFESYGTSGTTGFYEDYITLTGTTGSGGRRQGVYIKEIFDVTNISKLYFDYNLTAVNGNTRIGIYLHKNITADPLTNPSYGSYTGEQYITSPTEGTLELDVTAYSGEYYIYFLTLTDTGSSSLNINNLYYK